MWFTAVLTYLPVLPFHITIIQCTIIRPVFSPPCRVRCCVPVDVASTSGARVSGAHENMP